MQAALAEFKAEEVGQDQEEDVDFIVEKGAIYLIYQLFCNNIA